MDRILFAVNGTLMRGLELNGNLLAVGAEFIRETATAPNYRLWSIDDRYPAMLRDAENGAAMQVEVWQLSPDGLVRILEQEPPGLCLGKVELEDGSTIFGILGEPHITAGQREITNHGGWRNFLTSAKEKRKA
jgi:gamma-glutamylcyclotransferase (GGCT)/AIG2-like uncharacterized protein YtfP